MLELICHLKNRCMSQRAQGIVEYAIIIAFVIVIGWAIFHTEGTTSIPQYIQNIFSSLWHLLESAKDASHS